MEGPDPQPLIQLYEQTVVALKKWQEERQSYIELQKATDIAAKLTAEAAIRCSDAASAYDKALQTLEAAHKWRTVVTDAEAVLKLLKS